MKNKKIFKTLVITGLIFISSIGIAQAEKLDNPLGANDMKVSELIGRIINGILGIVGSLALVMFIYGGLTWMTSSGNEEKVKNAKKVIISAVFGIVVIFTSYSLLNLIFEILGS